MFEYFFQFIKATPRRFDHVFASSLTNFVLNDVTLEVKDMYQLQSLCNLLMAFCWHLSI